MENNTRLRWAILGAGRIARKFASDFKNVQNADLVAVASREPERARVFAEEFEIPKILDYESLYNSNEIDAIYIATPHNFHFEQARACIEHGKAVLCEKPITINDGEFKKLAALSAEKQVFLMEGMWTYFLPAVQKAKQWVTTGQIGAIKMIQADFGFKADFEPAGRLYNPALAGGALLDIGVYPFAFSTYFMGRKPGTIKASAMLGETKVDESTAMILDYSNSISVLHCSILNHSPIKAFIFGENGYIEIPHFYNAHKAFLYNNQDELLESFEDDRTTFGFEYEIQAATNDILQGRVQSEIMPHEASNIIQEIMTEIRAQVGVKYPTEKV